MKFLTAILNATKMKNNGYLKMSMEILYVLVMNHMREAVSEWDNNFVQVPSRDTNELNNWMDEWTSGWRNIIGRNSRLTITIVFLDHLGHHRTYPCPTLFKLFLFFSSGFRWKMASNELESFGLHIDIVFNVCVKNWSHDYEETSASTNKRNSNCVQHVKDH